MASGPLLLIETCETALKDFQDLMVTLERDFKISMDSYINDFQSAAAHLMNSQHDHELQFRDAKTRVDDLYKPALLMAKAGILLCERIMRSGETESTTHRRAARLRFSVREIVDLLEPHAEELANLEGAELVKLDVDEKQQKLSLSRSYKQYKSLYMEQAIKVKNLEKSIKEGSDKILGLKASIDALGEATSAEIQKAVDIRNSALSELNQKKEKMDEILGYATEGMMAGDFAESAKDEKKSADMYRLLAIIIMMISVIFIGFAFHETTTEGFDWKVALFRALLAIALSVPAAYLAREASKHRDKHYSYKQTSLDIKAVDPYIGTLPESEQHRIKAEIASKLFSATKTVEPKSDSYPINIQEVLIELIKRLEASKPDKK